MEDIETLLAPYRSNFHITYQKLDNEFKNEYIEYIEVNNSRRVTYTYDIGDTLLTLLNNIKSISALLNKYNEKFRITNSMNFNDTITLLDDLRKDILSISNNLYILIMYIDDLVFEIKQKENLFDIKELNLLCTIRIFSLIEEVHIVTNFTLSSYFRTFNTSNVFDFTELENNINLWEHAFETYIGSELYLPRVKIYYNNKSEEEYSTVKNTNRKNAIKKEILSYQYSICSLTDLANATLYHLQCSDKAILCCSVCGKYFIRKKHSYDYYNDKTGNDETKIITEKNSRITCSNECLKKSRQKSLKEKRTTSCGRLDNSLRTAYTRLDKKYHTNLLEEYKNSYCTLKKKLENKWGKESREIINEELLKFLLKEEEKMKNIRKDLRQRRNKG